MKLAFGAGWHRFRLGRWGFGFGGGFRGFAVVTDVFGGVCFACLLKKRTICYIVNIIQATIIDYNIY